MWDDFDGFDDGDDDGEEFAAQDRWEAKQRREWLDCMARGEPYEAPERENDEDEDDNDEETE